MIIPEVQERLHQIADELRFPLLFPRPVEDIGIELHLLSDTLSRRASIDRAPNSSVPMTAEIAQAVRDYKAAHPRATYQKMAERFGVNTARISEAIRGKRK